MRSSGFFGIFAAPSTMDFRYIAHRRHRSLHILMLTGLAAPTHASLHPATVYSSVIIWSLGPPNDSKLSPGRVRRLSIVVLPTSSLRHAGYASSCPSFNALFSKLLWSTATTSPPSTFQRTWFNINVPSMWRLIFISFVSALLLEMSVFSTFRRHLSMLIEIGRAHV